MVSSSAIRQRVDAEIVVVDQRVLQETLVTNDN
jgi:hypothetical protein